MFKKRTRPRRFGTIAPRFRPCRPHDRMATGGKTQGGLGGGHGGGAYFAVHINLHQAGTVDPMTKAMETPASGREWQIAREV